MAGWFSELFKGAVEKEKTDAPAQSEELPEQNATGAAAEEEIRQKLEDVLDREINPAISGHGGYIAIERVEGKDVYITMQGGCQGCAASRMTLRMGVEQAFRDVVPDLGEVIDVTDHAAGENPFYTQWADLG